MNYTRGNEKSHEKTKQGNERILYVSGLSYVHKSARLTVILVVIVVLLQRPPGQRRTRRRRGRRGRRRGRRGCRSLPPAVHPGVGGEVGEVLVPPGGPLLPRQCDLLLEQVREGTQESLFVRGAGGEGGLVDDGGGGVAGRGGPDALIGPMEKVNRSVFISNNNCV